MWIEDEQDRQGSEGVDSSLQLSLTCAITRSFGTPTSSWCFVTPPQLAQLLRLEMKAQWEGREGLLDQVTIRRQQCKPCKRIGSLRYSGIFCISTLRFSEVM